jgi:hypothetical protein
MSINCCKVCEYNKPATKFVAGEFHGEFRMSIKSKPDSYSGHLIVHLHRHHKFPWCCEDVEILMPVDPLLSPLLECLTSFQDPRRLAVMLPDQIGNRRHCSAYTANQTPILILNDHDQFQLCLSNII